MCEGLKARGLAALVDCMVSRNSYSCMYDPPEGMKLFSSSRSTETHAFYPSSSVILCRRKTSRHCDVLRIFFRQPKNKRLSLPALKVKRFLSEFRTRISRDKYILQFIKSICPLAKTRFLLLI